MNSEIHCEGSMTLTAQDIVLPLLPFALLGVIWLCGLVDTHFPSKSDH
jgi:hypothetical protein